MVPQMLKQLTHWVHICSTPPFPRLPRDTPSSPLVHSDWSHRVCPRYTACLSLQLDTKQSETCIYIILGRITSQHIYIYLNIHTRLYIIVYDDTVIMYIYICSHTVYLYIYICSKCIYHILPDRCSLEVLPSSLWHQCGSQEHG